MQENRFSKCDMCKIKRGTLDKEKLVMIDQELKMHLDRVE